MHRPRLLTYSFITLLACASPAARLAAQAGPPAAFEEVPPAVSHITWVHENGRSKEHYLPETMGGGCAFLDYDNDGWLDIYLVNGGRADFYAPARPLRNALYRNNRDGSFTDVTEKAGVGGGQYGMGAAVADYDGDGWQDIFVTNYGTSYLYRNNGDGTFTDVAEKVGLRLPPGFWTSAAWLDFDSDGRLDLFVCDYAFFNKAQNLFCTGRYGDKRFYCNPQSLRPLPSRLYRNNGDGTFADVSKAANVAGSFGKALGVVATDVNNDRLTDLFVANDTEPNFLFVNRGGGRFEEVGTQAGVAYGASGAARSGMGVDAADVDGDGWQDLFVANIDGERYSLYRNNHDLTFDDADGEIAEATRPYSGWGLKFFDYDLDGDPDLINANSHPEDQIALISQRVTYREPSLLFENAGGRFVNVSASAGPVFKKNLPARGLAVGDIDNDGDPDVLITNIGEAPVLLRNRTRAANNWLGLRLVATKSNAASVGALITWQAGGVRRSRLKTGGGSYLSAHDPREVLGLGRARKVDAVEIRWPSGLVEKLSNLPVNRYVRVVEGRGIVPD